jgi:putative endopeptidase
MKSTCLTLLLATVATLAVAADPAPGAGPAELASDQGPVGAEQVARDVLQSMDQGADPCRDFYQYACGGWLSSTQLPADKPIWLRSFSTVFERNQKVVRELLESAATDPGDDNQTLVVRFYGACMDEAAVEKAGRRPLAPLLRRIEKVEDATALMAVTGELHRLSVGALFGLGVVADFKNPEVNVAFLSQGGLSLPDRDYYLSQEEDKRALREAYQKHVARMLGLVGEDSATAARHAAEVLAFETRLATASRPVADMRQLDRLYNKLDISGLKQLTPRLPWDAYLAAVGDPALTQINVATPEFFTALEKLVLESEPALLKTYLRWQAVNSGADLLTSDFVQANFDFFGKTLAGQQQLAPRWKRCVDATNGALGEAVGRLYVEKMFAGSSKEIALEMIRDLEAAFADNLPQVAWMDDVTRQRALEKLEAITNKIGYPDRWRDYSKLRLSRSSYFKSSVAAAEFEFGRELAKVGKAVDRSEWGMSPQTVNAYYNPLQNEIAFPAGILQPPFFYRDFPAAMNYGAIGGAIGHELTHGFDDQGRKFDAAGRLREWWEPEVSARFEKRAQCVSDLYATYEVEPGVHLNGPLTLGENIADIAALKEILAAYRLWATRHGAPAAAVAGLTNEQLLFVAWGQVWCAVMSPELARLQVSTDPHSPARFRVNGPMANTPAFAVAFQCAPGTPMNPEKRCEVW